MSSKKILIINPFGIGDVLFTTPLVSELRKAYPDAFIGYIANRRALPIVESNLKIDKVYIYERDEFQKDLMTSWMGLFNEIRSKKFDIVFDFSLNTSFGFFSMICGIKQRIGYDYRNRGRFLTHKIYLKGYEDKHIVEYYLDLLELYNGRGRVCLCPDRANARVAPTLEIFIDAKHEQWAQDWIKQKGINPNNPIIAVIPGGGASWGKDANQKRWPSKNYALLVDKIIAKTGAAVILMGDQKEQQLCQELTHQCSGSLYSAVGETSVLQMAALLQLCRLAIVNDGGPLHIAVAAGVKTASIFGPVDPLVYGPFPSKGHVVIQKELPCQPCYRRFRKAACSHLNCLNQLEVEEVFNQIVGVIINRPYVEREL